MSAFLGSWDKAGIRFSGALWYGAEVSLLVTCPLMGRGLA